MVMTILAFQTEETRMDIWLRMTLVAQPGSASINEVGVTRLTIDFGMASF